MPRSPAEPSPWRNRLARLRRAFAPISACSTPSIQLLIGRKGDEIVDSWIFSGGNACVKDMFVGGQHVVADRRHVREDEIAIAYRKAVEKLQ